MMNKWLIRFFTPLIIISFSLCQNKGFSEENNPSNLHTIETPHDQEEEEYSQSLKTPILPEGEEGLNSQEKEEYSQALEAPPLPATTEGLNSVDTTIFTGVGKGATESKETASNAAARHAIITVALFGVAAIALAFVSHNSGKTHY